MAEPVSAQERLDKIVVLVAANLVAEACSVYLLRKDGKLELFASEGLRPQAIHHTFLSMDAGLVGLVATEARAVNLSDIQRHPAYLPQPKTGDDIYHSFLGVPILRKGNTLGVLAINNRAQRTYSEDEEEVLQTTAMVLAEMVASGELSMAPPAKRRRGGKRNKAVVARKEIAEIEPSKEKLKQVRDLLDACVGVDVDPQKVGNRTQLPIHSDALDTIKIAVEAGIQIHESPLLVRHHMTMLENVRAILIEYNKTLEVLNGSVSKTTKLVWGISKLAGLVIIPTAFTTQLSSAIAAAIGSLGVAIAACRAALGI